MTVHILTIGDEILIGQIIDTNSAWMGQQLNLIGAQINRITSISDSREAILEALKTSDDAADVVLITGGLGPTKDDITKKTMAEYFGVEMELHQPTWERIQRFFKKLGRDTTPAHYQQCYMPTNATILVNKMGTAPGMWFQHNNTVFVSMPGVPYEMKYLMENEVIPKLVEKFDKDPIAHRTILTVGEGESRIAQRLESFEDNLPDHIKLAYLPNIGNVRLRLTGRMENEEELDAELDKYVTQIQQIIPDLIYGYERKALEAAIGEMLHERGLTITTAESCTGGYIAHKITSVPGSSAYFQGSVIPYDNRLKMKLLNVKPATLETHGAVSEATVTEMVAGALQLMGTDIALATSGIAGPTGGIEEKPVGTIWMAVGNKGRIKTRLLHAGKDRLKNIQYATTHALNLVRQFLLEEG